MPDTFTTTYIPSSTPEAPRDMSYRPDGDGVEFKTNVKPPLSYYTKVNAKTYTEDFFKIDAEDYGDEISLIEDFIGKQIQKLKLEDSTDSYDDLINSIIEKLNISKNEILSSRIEKIINYIKLLNRNLTKEDKIKSLQNRKKESDNRINKLKSLI